METEALNAASDTPHCQLSTMPSRGRQKYTVITLSGMTLLWKHQAGRGFLSSKPSKTSRAELQKLCFRAQDVLWLIHPNDNPTAGKQCLKEDLWLMAEPWLIFAQMEIRYIRQHLVAKSWGKNGTIGGLIPGSVCSKWAKWGHGRLCSVLTNPSSLSTAG